MSEDQQAQTPLSDLVMHAVERMEQGARMRLDAIPGDTSLSVSSHGPEVTAEIARRLRLLMTEQKSQRVTCNGHERVYEDGSGYICRHCGKDMDDED